MSKTSSRYFHRFGTRHNIQLNLTRYNAGFGIRTWPKTYHGVTKRAVHFGLGYVSWVLL